MTTTQKEVFMLPAIIKKGIMLLAIGAIVLTEGILLLLSRVDPALFMQR